MMTIYGMNIITNSWLEEDESHEVTRTWKERLFSRPWKPFKKTKTVIRKIPSKSIYKLNENTLAMHPVMAARLEKELKGKYGPSIL